MGEAASPYVVFRVAAGARIGYGHLRRATVLARALRRPALVSVRGGGTVPPDWAVAPGTARQVLALRPRLLVVDDPRAAAALPWVREAHRRGVPTASLHDLGLAGVPTDLAIDGSLRATVGGLATRRLTGAAYAVIDVRRPRRPRLRSAPSRPRVLLSFGGGRQRALLAATVRAIADQLPDAQLLVPAGFGGSLAGLEHRGGAPLALVHAPDGLSPLLARADLAITAGGLTLYEAAALGVPTIAVPVVAAQQPTIRAFVRAGLAQTVAADGGPERVARRLAARASRLWQDVESRGAMAARGPAAVDGGGARRVALALHALVEGHGG